MSVVCKIKLLSPDAVLPVIYHQSDCGADITATDLNYDNADQLTYNTGLAIEIPKGYVGLIFPRSSIHKYDLALANSVGVIDSGYRGEIKVKFNLINDGENIYKVGDKICQLIVLPYPEVSYILAEELAESDRGERGFGSTTPIGLGGCV